MTSYQPVSLPILAELRKIVGERHVWTEPDKIEPYAHDEVTGEHNRKAPEAVVRPANAQEVAEIVRLANRERIPVVPRGAGTGLAGGAVAFQGGIVLSTERMNRILEVDEQNMVIVTEPGVRVVELQEAAAAKGLFYAGDPSSGESAFIGGNIATNAGGLKAVKYGTTRQQVMGVELVTPEGELVALGGKLRKDSTGYCLTQLVAGSEGTLGIVTKAILRLVSRPPQTIDLVAVFPTLDAAVGVVPTIVHSGIMPVCVEFMDNESIQSVQRYLKMQLPHSEDGYYILLALESDSEEVLDQQCTVVNDICMQGGAIEILAADPARIWKARKSCAEADRSRSLVFSSEDMVVPVSRIADMVRKMKELGAKYGIEIHCAGHAADGNIHAHLLKDDIPDDEWEDRLEKIRAEVYRYAYGIGGKVSGEHGIGYKRRALLEQCADPVELKMMKAIKRALDPNGIMNPGKVIATEPV